MRTSEQLYQVATALSAALGEMQDVVKSMQGYGYKYASLDQLTSMSRPILARHGLALLQEATATDIGACVTTRILHASGQWVETDPLPMVVEAKKGLSAAQNLGAVLTYARRYQLQALLNVAAEEDTDARREEHKKDEAAERAERDALLSEVRDLLAATETQEAALVNAYAKAGRALTDLATAPIEALRSIRSALAKKLAKKEAA